ncbi:MAG: protein kinase [Moraxellaceae bacterium]|nr:protein kinase [Moraxellaceae bacterium]
MSEPLIPGYTLISTLGKGGMATVYLAMHEKFEREVALKVMAPALSADAGFRERFLREAKIVAKISHPNIVTVYDVNEVDGVHYIAMEYHSGGDLKARLREGLSVREALTITKEIARALAYAHSKGYVHRDIKPDNILFRVDGSAVLTDFGIAKATEGDANLTQMGMVAGTPKYMSPEQARGQQLDGDSDLYSLGIVLFEMLTGRLPYEASDAIALGIMHMNAPIPKLEGRLAHFQPLLDRLLAKQAAQRPQNGTELIREIEALEAGFDFDLKPAAAADQATVVRPAMRATVAPKGELADDATVVAPSAAAHPPMAQTADKPTRAPLAAAMAAVLVLMAGGGWWWSGQSSSSDRIAEPVPATVVPAAEELPSALSVLKAQVRAALAANDLDVAERHLKEAYALEGADAELLPLQMALDVARQAAVERVARERRQSVRSEQREVPVAPSSDPLRRLKVRGMLGSAQQALEDGDVQTAIARYQQLLQLEPGNSEAKAGLRQAQAR